MLFVGRAKKTYHRSGLRSIVPSAALCVASPRRYGMVELVCDGMVERGSLRWGQYAWQVPQRYVLLLSGVKVCCWLVLGR